MSILPDNILKRMAPEDRKAMGKSGVTNEEADAKCQAGKERELQKQIANWLRLNGFLFIQSRTDKRTTNGNGVPDFIVFLRGGNMASRSVLPIECKTVVGKLSEEQRNWHIAYAKQTGRTIPIARSLKEVIIAIINEGADINHPGF